jgi:hypothetical protein
LRAQGESPDSAFRALRISSAWSRAALHHERNRYAGDGRTECAELKPWRSVVPPERRIGSPRCPSTRPPITSGDDQRAHSTRRARTCRSRSGCRERMVAAGLLGIGGSRDSGLGWRSGGGVLRGSTTSSSGHGSRGSQTTLVRCDRMRTSSSRVGA